MSAMHRVGYHYKEAQSKLQELETLAGKLKYTSDNLSKYIGEAKAQGELLLQMEKEEMVGLNCCLVMNQKIMVGAFNWLQHLGKRDTEVEDTPLIKDKTTFVLGMVMHSVASILTKLVLLDVKEVVNFMKRFRNITGTDQEDVNEFLTLQHDIMRQIFRAITFFEIK